MWGVFDNAWGVPRVRQHSGNPYLRPSVVAEDIVHEILGGEVDVQPVQVDGAAVVDHVVERARHAPGAVPVVDHPAAEQQDGRNVDPGRALVGAGFDPVGFDERHHDLHDDQRDREAEQPRAPPVQAGWQQVADERHDDGDGDRRHERRHGDARFPDTQKDAEASTEHEEADERHRRGTAECHEENADERQDDQYHEQRGCAVGVDAQLEGVLLADQCDCHGQEREQAVAAGVRALAVVVIDVDVTASPDAFGCFAVTQVPPPS